MNAKCQASAQGAESAVEHKFISLLLRSSCPGMMDPSPKPRPIISQLWDILWAANRWLKKNRSARRIVSHQA